MNTRVEAPGQVDEDTNRGVTRTGSVLARLVLLSVIVLLLGQIVVAAMAVTGFEKALEPQLSQKAGAVGKAVADQIEFVVDGLGIPPKDLVGVDPYLQKNSRVQRGHPVSCCCWTRLRRSSSRAASRRNLSSVFCPTCRTRTAQEAPRPRWPTSSTASSRSRPPVVS